MTQASSWACSMTFSQRPWSLCLAPLTGSLNPRQASLKPLLLHLPFAPPPKGRLSDHHVNQQCAFSSNNPAWLCSSVREELALSFWPSVIAVASFSEGNGCFRSKKLLLSLATSLMRPSASRSANCGRSLWCAGQCSYWVQLVAVSQPSGRL